MARGRESLVVPVSVLDRLLDETLDRPLGRPADPNSRSTWEWDLQDYVDSVRRDLSWLLNTRRTPEAVPGEPEADPEDGDCPLVRESVFTYGVRDPSSISLSSDVDKRRIRMAILDALARFEPRIEGVEVQSMADPSAEKGRLDLWFRIVGDLRVDPEVTPILFDTRLKLENRAHEVRGEQA